MTELRKRGVLKIAVGSVFICLFISALMYPLIFARHRGKIHRDKIHFLASPNPHAVYSVPPSKEADIMIVWVAVMTDSTYGSFTMALVGYDTYYTEYTHHEIHWYTDRLKTGETYAYLGERTYPSTDVVEQDVSVAKIDITTSEHQLNATVIVRGKTLFSVGFWADTSVPIESRAQTLEALPQELFLSVEAYRPILQASVTGLEVGDFLGGRFDYIDTELYDPSLLP